MKLHVNQLQGIKFHLPHPMMPRNARAPSARMKIVENLEKAPETAMIKTLRKMKQYVDQTG